MVPMHWHIANQLALGQLCWGSCRSVALWTRDPQLVHTKLEGGSLDPKNRCRTIRSPKDPMGQFQDSQDMLSFHLFEGCKSICIASLGDA